MAGRLGLRFRKADAALFLSGAAAALVLVGLVYILVRAQMPQGGELFALLAEGRRKLIYYFLVAFSEELLFRGALFGAALGKIRSVPGRILLGALVFALPHMANSDNAPATVMAAFALLYGAAACEAFLLTGSLWLGTGFHWAWNYAITSVFWTTGTQDLTYGWILPEMLAAAAILAIAVKNGRVCPIRECGASGISLRARSRKLRWGSFDCGLRSG